MGGSREKQVRTSTAQEPERREPLPLPSVRARGMRPYWLFSAVVLVVFALWSLFFVTTNMDEVCMFHGLARCYPSARFNTFGPGSCSSNLIDYGFFSYHRAYDYIGITSSILYFPLWSVWRSIYSYYLLGFVFIFTFSIALVKALGLERRYIFIPLGYFPIAYLFIHDTGPVRLGLLSFPALTLLTAKIIDSNGLLRKIIYCSIASALVVFCVEDKPFYLYLLPTLFLFIIGCRSHAIANFDLRKDIRDNAIPFLFFCIALSVSLYILLCTGKVGEFTYFKFLTNSVQESISLARQFKFICKYTFSFPSFGHRNFDISPLAELFGLLPVLLFIPWLVRHLRRTETCSKRILVLFGASYLIGLLVFLSIRNTWAGHHFVFLQVPLVSLLLILAKTDSKAFKMVLTFVLLSNVYSVAVLSASPIGIHCARERELFFDYFDKPEIASKNIINFSSWGGYYYQSIYGDDSQLVTWSEQLNPTEASKLTLLAKETHKNIINACLDCSPNLMTELFPTSKVSELELGLNHWKVFQIYPH